MLGLLFDRDVVLLLALDGIAPALVDGLATLYPPMAAFRSSNRDSCFLEIVRELLAVAGDGLVVEATGRLSRLLVVGFAPVLLLLPIRGDKLDPDALLLLLLVLD